MEWKGYRGRVIEVDLSIRKCGVRELREEDALDSIGGAGLNARLLYDLTSADTQALSPLNPLIIGAGPLVGTQHPASARATVTAISPLTGIFGDSNGGGFFGARLKKAGYDGIVVSGCADSPCYLLIDGDNARVEDAGDLWGLETDACERELRNTHTGSSVVCIGPAGENLVSYACIMGNGNSCSFSRSGMGAVMGSKKLKAVVVKGGDKVPVYNPEGLKRLSRQVEEMVGRYPACRIFSRSGTPVLGTIYSLFKVASEYNGRRAARARIASKLGPRAFNRQFDWEPRGCWNCPLRCHKHYVTRAGKYKGEKGTKHEVGYISPLGLNLGVHDLPAMLHLVNLCNDMGLDCREFAGTLGMVIDCLEQGILSASDLGGEIPTWGGVEAAERWIRAAAFRQGFGDVIADGVRKASIRIGDGAQRYALNIKGMFMENFDSPPSLCAFSVSTRGGDHLKGLPFQAFNPLRAGDMHRLCGASAWSMIPFSHRDKGRMVWWHENYKMLQDSLGICFFLCMTLGIHGHLLPDELADAYRLATGIEADGEELMRRAERSYLLERAFNARRGMRRADDSFVKRPEKRSAGKHIDLDHPGMLDEYYRCRGLDEDGIPLPRKLRELGLEEIAADIDGRAAVERADSDVERAHAGH